MEDIEKYLEVYKKEFNIDTDGQDIDEILGITDLNLTPYVWKPYNLKFEQFLQDKLKDSLLNEQRSLTDGYIMCESLFKEYNNMYILISPVKEITKKINNNGQLKEHTHLIISIYDGKNNYLKHSKRTLIKVSQKSGKFYYNKIKLSVNEFYEPFKEKFNSMGLFTNRGSTQQQIYTSRLLPAVYFINNNLRLTPNFEGHHVFFNTKKEILSDYSMLLIRSDKHSEHFHPDNTRGTNDSTKNQAKGILYTQMLKLKYFKVKEKKFNINVYTNLVPVLKMYFVDKQSITEIQRRIKEKTPKSTITYNTISAIVNHFKQYTKVLTPENIEYISGLTK